MIGVYSVHDNTIKVTILKSNPIHVRIFQMMEKNTNDIHKLNKTVH